MSPAWHVPSRACPQHGRSPVRAAVALAASARCWHVTALSPWFSWCPHQSHQYPQGGVCWNGAHGGARGAQDTAPTPTAARVPTGDRPRGPDTPSPPVPSNRGATPGVPSGRGGDTPAPPRTSGGPRLPRSPTAAYLWGVGTGWGPLGPAVPPGAPGAAPGPAAQPPALRLPPPPSAFLPPGPASASNCNSSCSCGTGGGGGGGGRASAAGTETSAPRNSPGSAQPPSRGPTAAQGGRTPGGDKCP